MKLMKQEQKEKRLEQFQNMNENPTFEMKKVSYPSYQKILKKNFTGFFKKSKS